MLPLTIARLASIALTALLAVSFRYPVYYFMMLGLGIAHIILSFVYAAPVLRNPGEPRFWGFIGLSVAAAILYMLPGDTVFRLLLVFGVHHTLNEVYLSKRYMPGQFPTTYGRLAAIAFHGVLYFALLINDDSLAFLDRRLVAVGLVVTSIAFVVSERDFLECGVAHKLNGSLFELVGLLLAVGALTGYVRIRFADIIFYHFILWAVIPLFSSAQRPGSFRLYYSIQTVAITVACFVLSPPALGVLPAALLIPVFYFGSYNHILTSFALSRAQPDWIVRIFNKNAPQSVTR